MGEKQGEDENEARGGRGSRNKKAYESKLRTKLVVEK